MGCGSSSSRYDPTTVDIRHFEMGRIIGQGGFGKVNAVIKQTGEDKGKMYAMKSLKKEVALKSDGSLAQIFTERSMLLELRHQFICNVHFCFQDEHHLYIILDLALGGDLRYRMKKVGKVPEWDIKFYMAQVFLALDHIHSRDILHRDIKPENIILEEDGYVKLTDLGISAKMEDGYCTKHSGTPGYMAPEITAKNNKHSIQADWFAMGVTIHELGTGKKPFNGRITMSAKANVEEARACMSEDAGTFLGEILKTDHEDRLGVKGFHEIKNHEWYTGFDWEALEKRQIKPTFLPDTKVANCDTGNNDVMEAIGGEKPKPIDPSMQHKFEGYEYNVVVPQVQSNGTS